VSKDVSDFQVLMALMLSSQTKDAVVGAAIKGMQEGIEGGLTMQGVHSLSDKQLDSFIAKVGFHNNKTKYIKAACEKLLNVSGCEERSGEQ